MFFYFYVKAFTFSINSNTVPAFDEQMIFVKSTLKEITDIKQDPYILKHKKWLFFARLGYTQTLNAIKSSVEDTEQKLLIEALNNFWTKITQDYQSGLNLLDLKMVNLHYVFILSNTEKNRKILQLHKENGSGGRYSEKFLILMNQDFSEVSFERYVHPGGVINQLSNSSCFFITFYCDDDGEFNVNKFLECFFGEPCLYISTLPSKPVNPLNVLPHASTLIEIPVLFYIHDLFHERNFSKTIVSDFFKKKKLNDLSFCDILKEDFIQYKNIPEIAIVIFSIIHEELDLEESLLRENEDLILFLKRSYYFFKEGSPPIQHSVTKILETKKSLLNSIELLLKTLNEDKKTRFYARILLSLNKIKVPSMQHIWNQEANFVLENFFSHDSFMKKYNDLYKNISLKFDHEKSQFFYKEGENRIYIKTTYKILSENNNIDKAITVSLSFDLADNQENTPLSLALKSYFQDIGNKHIPLTIFYPYELNSALNDFYPYDDRSNFLNEDQLKEALMLFKKKIFSWLDPENVFRNILNQECKTIIEEEMINNKLKNLNLVKIEIIKKEVTEIFQNIQKTHISLVDKIAYVNLKNLSLSEEEQEILKKIIEHKYTEEKYLESLLKSIDRFGTKYSYLDDVKLYKKILIDCDSLFLEYEQEKLEQNKLKIIKSIKYLVNNFNDLYFF